MNAITYVFVALSITGGVVAAIALVATISEEGRRRDETFLSLSMLLNELEGVSEWPENRFIVPELIPSLSSISIDALASDPKSRQRIETVLTERARKRPFRSEGEAPR